MTERQRKYFYFPAWNRCAVANDWRMRKGRMIAEQPAHDIRLPELTQVWTFARQIALTEHRGIEPGDLRHACHIVALGRDKSSHKLTNAEVNRVVDLFNRLAEPDSIASESRWSDPDISRRQSLVETIKKIVPYAYAKHIAQGLTSSTHSELDWERDLTLDQLGQLHRICKERNPRRPAPQQPREHRTTNIQRPTTNFPKLEYIKKPSAPSPKPELVEQPF